MLILYDKNERQFLSNGIGRLDKYAFDDKVREELNGIYKLDFTYPIHAPHSKDIKNENIVRATVPDGEQPFFISRIVKKDGYLRVTAYHLFYRLIWELIEDINIVNLSGQAAINKVLENTEFTGVSDIAATNNVRIVRYNAVEAILNPGKDNTLISRFGGELKRDKLTVMLMNRIGRTYENNPIEIRYAKNLLSYEADISDSSLATRVMPIGFDGLLLPEKYVVKPGADPNDYKTLKVEYSTIRAISNPEYPKEGELPLEDAYEALRQAVLTDFENGRFDIKASYQVKFQELSTTEEYKNKSVLEKVYIGDEVKVIHTDEDLKILSRVNAYEWSPIRKEYDEVELGSHIDTFSDIKPTLELIAGKVEQYKTDWENNVDEITELLTTALGGYVLKRPGELLIMDTEDPATAIRVWRWNLNGLGYSGTGINGPYETAITMDGRIIAKFIYALNLSSISANLGTITAGRIQDANSESYWDLDSGEIVLNVQSLKINAKSVATEEDIQNIELTPGPEGQSAYEAAVANGFTGTIQEWLASLEGPPGADGYTPVKGTDYFDGQDGQDGTSSYLWVRYSQNANGSGMTTSPTDAKYIGTATTTTPSVPTYTSFSWSLIKGTDGLPGEDGIDGKTSYLHIKYSDDGGDTFTANSGETVGAWIGTCVDFNSADPTTVGAYTWNKVKGEPGPEGIKGEDGIDGVTYYTWVRYADTPTTGMHNLPDGKKYMGIAYNKTTPTESDSYGDYSWSLIKGTDGVNGADGADGTTTYTWVKYADTELGAGMHDLPDGKRYIGLAFNKTTPNESNNAVDYNWSPLYDNVQVGGRNIFKDSDYSSKTSGTAISLAVWGGNIQVGSYDSDTPSGLGGLSEKRICTSAGSGGGAYHDEDSFELEEGETYTLSYWAKGLEAKSHNQYYVCLNRGSDNYYINPIANTNITTNWKKYYGTFTVATGKGGVYKRRSIIYVVSTSWISHFKLEKGNIATDWTPAPEDIETRVHSVEQEITPSAITNTFLTEFSKADTRTITKGIIKLDQTGINVAKSTSEVNTQIAHDGLSVRDGDTTLASFGEAGAVIPNADIEVLSSPKVVQMRPAVTVNVGSGYSFNSVNDALDWIFPTGTRFIEDYVVINVYSNLAEDILISNIHGGKLIVNMIGRTITGSIEVRNCTARVELNGSSSSYGTIKKYNEPIYVHNSRNVYIYYLNINGDGGSAGVKADYGSIVHMHRLDIVNCSYGGLSSGDSWILMRDCIGSPIAAGRAQYGGSIKATGEIPKGTGGRWGTNRGYISEFPSITEVQSAYSPPPVTSQVFTQTFTSATFDTLIHGTTNIDSYYGSTATQNRWDSSMGWKDGRVRLSSAIYNFFNGGSNISIRYRLRRKNSTHGSSLAVKPAPYNHSASFSTGATRGGWTSWATVPSGLFTSAGATLTFYNGVQGSSGYAIWDAIEVEVTVTKQV